MPERTLGKFSESFQLFRGISTQLVRSYEWWIKNPVYELLLVAFRHVGNIPCQTTVKPLFHRHGALFFKPSPIVVFY